MIKALNHENLDDIVAMSKKREIVSTDGGFAVVENGEVVSEHNRDDELDNLLQTLQNNKHIQETINEAAAKCRKPIVIDIIVGEEFANRATKAGH